ncbi:MAG TPA: response regulator [bacterium]|nr:response regulator [bacterium]
MAIKKVMVVDDDPIMHRLFQRMLEKEYEVKTASSGFEAIELFKKETFDVVFLDVMMPQMDGVETLKNLKAIRPETTVVMMTGFTVDDKVKESMDLGAYEYIYKPFALSEIQAILYKLTELGEKR